MQNATDNTALIVFRVGPVMCCAHAQPVQSIIAPPKLTRTPGSTEARPGIFHHSDYVVQVSDLRVRFGISASQRKQPGRLIITQQENGHVAFWVDDILEVIQSPKEGWGKLPGYIPTGIFSRTLLLNQVIHLYVEIDKLDDLPEADYLSQYLQKIAPAEEGEPTEEETKPATTADEAASAATKMTHSESTIRVPTPVTAARKETTTEDVQPREKPLTPAPAGTDKSAPESLPIDVADKDTRNDTDAATHIETVPSGTPLTEEATPPETVTPAATETPIEHATEFPLTTTEPEHEPVAEKVAEPEPVSEPLDQPAPRFDAAPAAEPAQDKTAPVEPAVAAKPEETVTLAPADKHDSTSDTTAPAEPSRKKRATYELSDNHELIPPEKKAAKQQAKSGFLPTAAAVLLVILAGGGTTAYLLLQPDRSGDKPEIKTTAKSTTPTTVTPARDKPAAQNSDVMTEGDRPAPADSAADRRDTAGAKDNQSTYRAEIKHDAKGVTIELDAPTDEPVLTEPADGGDVATATADREKSTPSEQQKTGKKTGNKTKSRKVREITHIVVKGDTLWDIAQHYVNNPYKYPELAKLSNIKNPDRIYPGDRVRIIHKSSSR